VLINLFSPGTAAQFHYRRDSRVATVMAKMYEFEVDREHSSWSIHMGAQSYMPAYSGAVWIDPQTARVLRIEMEGKGMPESFRSTMWNRLPITPTSGSAMPTIPAAGALGELELPAWYTLLLAQRDRLPELSQVHRRIEHQIRQRDEGREET